MSFAAFRSCFTPVLHFLHFTDFTTQNLHFHALHLRYMRTLGAKVRMSGDPLFTWVSEDRRFLSLHFLENENRSREWIDSKLAKADSSPFRGALRRPKCVAFCRNRENEVNQGMESSFHYPSKKKYVMFTYVMCKQKTEFDEC